MAAVRATREAQVWQGGERVDCIVGAPMRGERIGAEVFDGEGEVAAFPGDLPADPTAMFAAAPTERESAFRALRFRPPLLERTADGRVKGLPHIRLDRALEFLIGDRLR
jgi:predicted YcjX-like family ATPase